MQPKLYSVERGSTLYIPAFYWHWVYSEGAADDDDGGNESVALNLWTSQPHRHVLLCLLRQLTLRIGTMRY